MVLALKIVAELTPDGGVPVPVEGGGSPGPTTVLPEGDCSGEKMAPMA